MATIGTSKTVNVIGKSGTSYEFYVYKIPVTFLKKGGIYFFVKENSAGNQFIPIYLGITNDLSERFDNHHKWDCIRKNGATHILATVEENETTRQKIEKDILLAVNTSCNEVHN